MTPLNFALTDLVFPKPNRIRTYAKIKISRP
jgi:hypothetical protein